MMGKSTILHGLSHIHNAIDAIQVQPFEWPRRNLGQKNVLPESRSTRDMLNTATLPEDGTYMRTTIS